jgi:ketosteroid isomerase-like protein
MPEISALRKRDMTMRRLLVAPVIAGVLALSVACSNPFSTTTTSTDTTAALAPEVKVAVEGYLSKFNEHDATAVGEFYADDAAFQWVEDGRVVYETRTAAIAGLANFFAGFGGSRLEAYDVKIAMLSEGAAVATFKYTQTIAAAGPAALKAEGAMTLSLTQSDGSWKIMVGHKSANGFAR